MIDETKAAIEALPDHAELCATGLELDPIAAVPLFISGADVKAIVTENKQLREALADAIRRPLGVVPDSAQGLVTQADVDAAERRRQERGAFSPSEYTTKLQQRFRAQGRCVTCGEPGAVIVKSTGTRVGRFCEKHRQMTKDRLRKKRENAKAALAALEGE